MSPQPFRGRSEGDGSTNRRPLRRCRGSPGSGKTVEGHSLGTWVWGHTRARGPVHRSSGTGPPWLTHSPRTCACPCTAARALEEGDRGATTPTDEPEEVPRRADGAGQVRAGQGGGRGGEHDVQSPYCSEARHRGGGWGRHRRGVRRALEEPQGPPGSPWAPRDTETQTPDTPTRTPGPQDFGRTLPSVGRSRGVTAAGDCARSGHPGNRSRVRSVYTQRDTRVCT